MATAISHAPDLQTTHLLGFVFMFLELKKNSCIKIILSKKQIFCSHKKLLKRKLKQATSSFMKIVNIMVNHCFLQPVLDQRFVYSLL